MDVWPLRRLDAASLPSWRSAVLEKIPLFAISAAAAVTTYAVQQAGGAVKAIPTGLRISNALVSWVVYISKFVWPSRLAIFYPYPKTVPVWEAILSAAALLAISALVIRAFRARPYLATGWFWFAGTLVPVIGLVQVGEQARADRYMYVPMIGLGIILAWGAADILRSRPRGKAAIAAATAILCVVWGALTLKQEQYWRNSETVFQHALQAAGPSYVAEHNLGDYLIQVRGRVSEAIPHLQAALAMKPGSAEAHTDLGSAYAALPGRLGDAIGEYRAALSIAPDSAIPHNDLGNALMKSGRLQDAVSEYETALRINPDYAEAHNNLGAALAQLGRMPDAVAQFQAALNLDPHDSQARRNLDAALAQSSKTPDPDETHYNSGLGLLKAGRTQDAIAEFEAALRINPDYAEAHNNLGVALSKTGRLGDAMSEFQAALRIQPDYADAHYNAGVALANAGRIQEAEQQLEAAERIKPDPGTRRLLDELRRARR
jgi:tetratricopeptide (TPR) repeat protein